MVTDESGQAGTPFSLLLGYDESSCSETAAESLVMAGLPSTGSAVVMSIAEIGEITASLGYGYPVLSPDDIAQRIAIAKEATEKMAIKGALHLRSVLPGWKVDAIAKEGSCYWSLIDYAERHDIDLIVVGSHGRSAVGRVLLGSTSQFVVSHARCSVRVGRCGEGTAAVSESQPPKLLLAIDGSAGSDAVIATVARRNWPAGTEAHLLIAVDVGTTVAIRSRAAREPNRQCMSEPDGVLERAAKALEPTGLKLSGELKAGDPKRVIIEQAIAWSSDTIFVGAQGHTRLERLFLGSVSAAVAARARCSVEVVRERTSKPSTSPALK